ncbi:selenoprotein K [Morphnus guianensis]
MPLRLLWQGNLDDTPRPPSTATAMSARFGTATAPFPSAGSQRAAPRQALSMRLPPAHAQRGRGQGTGQRPRPAAMVYISNGQVLDNQSRAPWRLSSITDFFWSIADFVVLFFQSIIQPDLRRRGYTSSSYSGYNDGRGPPAHPRRRMGRINHWGGGPSPPPMAGGG